MDHQGWQVDRRRAPVPRPQPARGRRPEPGSTATGPRDPGPGGPGSELEDAPEGASGRGVARRADTPAG